MRNYIILLISLFTFSICAAQSVDRVEPPFWWTEMNNAELQLMLYGKDIGAMEVSINDSNVRVDEVHRPDNKNYLFVDLTVLPKAKPGVYNIKLSSNGKVIELDYEFKKRDRDSAARKGNDASDAIYLITPDRFANGDASNDEVAGMKEGLQRDKEYGRHGGDLKGISNHLEYIKDLGFTAIWLNPVLENDQEKWSYHGYATTDYYQVDRRFGSNEEYAALGLKAKEMGIGMIMDIIVNHCGSHHWWMTDPPYKDWINYQNADYQQTNHRKSTLLDPYTSKIDRKIMTEGWFVPAMPDLNQRNSFMSTYLIQNSIWWIEFAHISGIRQDTYSYPFREFMTEWTCAIRNEYPNFYIVGEEWVENASIISYWQEGKVNPDGYTSCLPGLMDFPMCFALHKGLTEEENWGKGLVRMYESLANDFVYADPSQLVIFPDNHDMSRIYTQLGEDFDLYKMAMAYILTTRGIPQIYYGTEIVMSNKGTDSHGVIRSDFPGGWKGDEVSVMKNVGLTEKQLEAKAFLSKLLNWRMSKTVIHTGDLVHFEPIQGVYIYFRYNDDEKVMVILNKNKDEYNLKLDRFDEMLAGVKSGVNILDQKKFNFTNESITLSPNRAFIIELF